MSVNTLLSGIVYNTNSSEAISDSINQRVYQEFYLPGDFVRGNNIIPPISGIQVMGSVEDGFASTATLEYNIDWYTDAGWVELVSGREIGAHVDGENVWFDIYLKDPLIITEKMLDAKFRFGVEAPNQTDPIRLVVPGITAASGYTFSFTDPYSGFNHTISYSDLRPGGIYQLGTGYLYWDPNSDEIIYSGYYGFNNFYYYNGVYRSYYYGVGNVEVDIQHNNTNSQMHFRLLAGVADTGQDILGNEQRQVVTASTTSSLDPFVDKKVGDYWLSKPNPSKFAVECLYFDVRSSNKAQVIDKISIDPLTTGIYFSVYYSIDGDTAGVDESSWENKLWARVPKTYLLDKKDTYVLPDPVTAKYICIEFTHLKAQEYDPGQESLPIKYKKHPKWVLDYFLARLDTETTEDTFVANRVNIAFNALDLAYNYYLDDLNQEPDSPTRLTPGDNANSLTQFLADRKDVSDQVDTTTLSQIKLAFNRFAQHPASNGPLDYIYTTYGPSGGTNYATEVTSASNSISIDVSSLNRQALIVEQNYPVMFFYVPSRHTYREVSAELTYNRAYFAGVKEIAFLREDYTSRYDSNLYIEGIGDATNVDRNDFFTTETFSWVTHPE